MRIARELKIHKCNACAKPLADDDFISLGLNIRARLQFFFDYLCPKCAHRGRYNLDLQPGIRPVEALEILASQIEDGEESFNGKIDWDSIRWE